MKKQAIWECRPEDRSEIAVARRIVAGQFSIKRYVLLAVVSDGVDIVAPGAEKPIHQSIVIFGARVEYDNGLMDGFLRAGSNDVYSIGYYGEQDIPFYGELARNYTTCDRYFASILGPTFPNRLFLHSAQTDRLGDTVNFTSLPTIWDRLAAAGVSAKYFYSNVPFLALWGAKYLGISHLYEEFLLS